MAGLKVFGDTSQGMWVASKTQQRERNDLSPIELLDALMRPYIDWASHLQTRADEFVWIQPPSGTLLSHQEEAGCVMPSSPSQSAIPGVPCGAAV